MKKNILLPILSCWVLFSNKLSYATKYDAYKFFLQGTCELKIGRIDNAIREYEKVISLDKNALAVYKYLIYLYWQSGNTQKAFEIADRINNLDGNNPQTTAFLATFYHSANKPDISKQLWEKTIELDDDNEVATAYLAIYYYSNNKLKESANYWHKFLKQQPDNEKGYFQLGIIQEKLLLYNDALKSYDKVITINPKAHDAYIAKARIYELMDDFNSATKEYEKYISTFSDNTSVLMYLGKRHYESKDYIKAKEYFLRAKKNLPNNIEVNFWLGLIYEKTGEIDKAAIEFKNISLIEEKNVSIIIRLGYYYSFLKNYRKAEKEFLKALKIEPLNNKILYLTGVNYICFGKYDKAIKYLSKAIELVPNFAEAYLYLGMAYDKNKDFKNSEKVLLKAIEINPDFSEAMNYLGHIYTDKGIKLKAAEIFLVRAVTLEQKNGFYLDSLGWLYYKQGKFELAEKVLLLAKKTVKDPIIYEHLGDIYTALDQISQAWITYSISYDFKQDKNVKKKLISTQKKMPVEEFYKQMLSRSQSNYLRLVSFKTGFKAQLYSNMLSKKFYIPFTYMKNNHIKLGITTALAMSEISILIKDSNYEITPKAAQKELPPEISTFICKGCDIFNSDFYKQFEDAKVTQKGNSITYSKGDNNLTLNLDTALIENFNQNGIIVKILKYEDFFISKIPVKIEFSFKKLKTKGILQATKILPN